MMRGLDRVPVRFRPQILRELGHGGEAVVYELPGERVLRVFRRKPHGAADIAAFYRQIATGATSFALPEIIEQGDEDGVAYSIDRLIRGRPLHELMPELSGADRTRALVAYTDAAFEIASLPAVRDEYGEFLRDDDSITAPTWNAYLLARMDRSLEDSPWLRTDVRALDAVVAWLRAGVEALPPAPKALVHGDYFPGNVLMSDDLSVAGVIDFGPLTVIGDPQIDLASAVMFLEVALPGYRKEDTEFVMDRLVSAVGHAIIERTSLYRAWYPIRFSPYRTDDPNLYAWCLQSLRSLASQL